MLDLARGHVAPHYLPSTDPRVEEAGGYQGVALRAGAYFYGEDRNGSLAMPLSQLREETPEIRRIADVSLVGALRLSLQPAPNPSRLNSCLETAEVAPGSFTSFELRQGGALLGARRKCSPAASPTPVAAAFPSASCPQEAGPRCGSLPTRPRTLGWP
jgi:hypothetical protein